MNLGGRPRAFKTPQELQNYFDQYLIYCVENSRMPNIAGFCVYLEVSKECLYNYKNYDGFSDSLKYIDLGLEDAVLNNTTQKDLLKIAYLNNRAGYTQRQEVTSTNTNQTINLNLEGNIQDLNSLLLQIKQEQDKLTSYNRDKENAIDLQPSGLQPIV